MSALSAGVARSVELAQACGAPPALVLGVALAAEAPDTMEAALRFVTDAGHDLCGIAARTTFPRGLAELEPELRFDPELARVRGDMGDHELRGKLVFRDLLGQRSFFQVAALAIAGLELSRADADLLEQLGVNTQLADARIWPLAITRRVAFRSGYIHGIVAGLAALLNPNMAVRPVGAFMRFLQRLDQRLESGIDIECQLQELLRSRERVPGVGRPALGPDERNAQVVELARAFGRDAGTSWKLAMELDAFFHRHKGVHINSAGLQGALMRDMGLSPESATAMCVLYFIVPVLAQAVYAEDQAVLAGRRIRAT